MPEIELISTRSTPVRNVRVGSVRALEFEVPWFLQWSHVWIGTLKKELSSKTVPTRTNTTATAHIHATSAIMFLKKIRLTLTSWRMRNAAWKDLIWHGTENLRTARLKNANAWRRLFHNFWHYVVIIQLACLVAFRSPVNGRFQCSDGVNWDTYCEFYCDRGYLLIGKKALTCQDDGGNVPYGIWNGVEPVCEGETVDNVARHISHSNMTSIFQRVRVTHCLTTLKLRKQIATSETNIQAYASWPAKSDITWLRETELM